MSCAERGTQPVVSRVKNERPAWYTNSENTLEQMPYSSTMSSQEPPEASTSPLLRHQGSSMEESRHSSSGTTSVSLDEKLADFHRILYTQMPPEKARAYRQAQEICPKLVQLESNPLFFLRRHDFRVWNAVTDFVGYWQHRLEIFGADRAFRPLTLTGDGALTADDIHALQVGYTALLPEHQSGSPVILMDPAVSPTLRQDTIARTFFYIRNVAALNPLSQTQGYFGLIRHSETWKQISCGEGFRNGVVALECMPLVIRHLIVLVKPAEAQDARDHIAMVKERNPVFNNFHILVDGEGEDNLLQKLEAQGFSRNAIPEYLDGGLPDQAAVAWLKKFHNGFEGVDYRISTESGVAASLAAKPVLEGESRADWGLRVLEETIHYMLDSEEKKAYLEALEVVPELVQSESDPKKFVESADYDGWTAAQKLCKYWFYRKKWFGHKAFRPMTINGKGALSPDDCKFIQQGFCQILPHDNSGCPVVILHSEGIARGVTIMRAVFYLMQKLLEDAASRTHGTVFVIHFLGTAGYIDAGKWAKGLDFVWNGVPTRNVKTWIVAQKESFSLSRGQALKESFRADPEIIELVSDPKQNLERMADANFSPNGTPVQFGGYWTERDFVAWLDGQLQSEEARDYTIYEDVSSRPLLERLSSGSRSAPSDTTEEMTLLVAMEQALKAMSDEETREIKVARRECSDLFAAESPPLRFLRAVEFDPLKAAQKLARYWKVRHVIFGKRAFLPLHLSKRGALDEKAVRIIKKGEMALLPEDMSGRPVLFIYREPAYYKRGAVDVDLQAFFYLLQVASENPRSQTEGVVAIRWWVPSLFASPRFADLIETGYSALPVQFYSHHLICPVPSAGQSSYLESITSKIYSFSKYFMSETTQVHLMTDKNGLQKELLLFDLGPSSLPRSAGGTWDEKTALSTWIKHRTSRETKVEKRLFPDGVPMDEPVAETTQSIEKAIEALEEAINLLPDDEKVDYLEAKQKVPDLVSKESNPIWFIRCERWNTWSAARRVALYWKKRKEYFGDRAHLPLNQSGEGALSKEDVALLSTGYICLLPRDTNGRDVICHDATRKPPGMLERRMRVLFYMGNILAENRKNQTEGSRFLMILSKISLDGGISKTMELAKEILPSVSYDVHIIHVPGESSKTTFIDKMVPSMLKILGSFLEEKTKVHANESKSTLLGRLESDDFHRLGIPSTVGGTWTYDQFYYWQEARIRMEWDLPLSAAQRKLVFDGENYKCRGLSELNDEEKVERKRRLNLLHSRRKREKEKVEIEVLKSQVARLEDEKHEEETENYRLQALLDRAHKVVLREQQQQQQQPFFSRWTGLGQESISPAQGGVSLGQVPPGRFGPVNPQSPDTARFQVMLPGTSHLSQIQGLGPRHVAGVMPAAHLNYQPQRAHPSFLGSQFSATATGGLHASASSTSPQNVASHAFSSSIDATQQHRFRLDPTHASKRQRLQNNNNA